MSIYYSLFTLLTLIIIFGVLYKIKGLKTALVATGVTLVGFTALYFGLIFLIVSSMD